MIWHAGGRLEVGDFLIFGESAHDGICQAALCIDKLVRPMILRCIQSEDERTASSTLLCYHTWLRTRWRLFIWAYGGSTFARVFEFLASIPVFFLQIQICLQNFEIFVKLPLQLIFCCDQSLTRNWFVRHIVNRPRCVIPIPQDLTRLANFTS